MSKKTEIAFEDNYLFYEKWHKKCRDFMLYFDGYVRGASTPIKKLITLLSELEELVFGETKTQSLI